MPLAPTLRAGTAAGAYAATSRLTWPGPNDPAAAALANYPRGPWALAGVLVSTQA
ncbi:MAG TPA: hypothetical protein VNF47_03225 [Streptosporangiaceae bacterium]|nr:hypothetical protein [Streptosporangiaceae bacterium]